MDIIIADVRGHWLNSAGIKAVSPLQGYK